MALAKCCHAANGPLSAGWKGAPTKRKRENKKAALSAVVSKLWRGTNNSASTGSLQFKDTSKLLALAEAIRPYSRYPRADGSEWRRFSANISMPLRSKRCELGGLRKHRRITAAPALVRAVAFSFGGVRTHGLIAPALYRFRGLMPCGEPLCSPLPVLRSANPHGVALPLGGGGRLQTVSNTGACHE